MNESYRFPIEFSGDLAGKKKKKEYGGVECTGGRVSERSMCCVERK